MLIRIGTHVGISDSSVLRIIKEIEGLIISYKEKLEQGLHQEGNDILLILGVDETWLEQMLLVCQELSSGYIFFEEGSTLRTADKWAALTNKLVTSFGSIKFFVSDRAKALIKLAEDKFSVISVADLFHLLQDLCKGLGLALSSKIRATVKELKKSQTEGDSGKSSLLEKKLTWLRDCWTRYKKHLSHINVILHPFTKVNQAQSSSGAETEIKAEINEISEIVKQCDIDDSGHVKKAERQVEDAVSVIDLWWTWVETVLSTMGLSSEILTWVITILLPYVYWKMQIRKSHGNSYLKSHYTKLYEKAKEQFDVHPITLLFSKNKLKEWLQWANHMVHKFQRASSQVEGRNGWLAQMNHNIRGVNNGRIKALTVIHNFDTHREDGTTPAERLFNKKFPSLFEYILDGIEKLPMPRQRKMTTKLTA